MRLLLGGISIEISPQDGLSALEASRRLGISPPSPYRLVGVPKSRRFEIELPISEAAYREALAVLRWRSVTAPDEGAVIEGEELRLMSPASSGALWELSLPAEVALANGLSVEDGQFRVSDPDRFARFAVWEFAEAVRTRRAEMARREYERRDRERESLADSLRRERDRLALEKADLERRLERLREEVDLLRGALAEAHDALRHGKIGRARRVLKGALE